MIALIIVVIFTCNISNNLYCNITLNIWNYFLPSFILQKKAIWENLRSEKGNNCNNNNLCANDFKFCHNYAQDLQFCQIYATNFKLRRSCARDFKFSPTRAKDFKFCLSNA
jgi:hypothetical protein